MQRKRTLFRVTVKITQPSLAAPLVSQLTPLAGAHAESLGKTISYQYLQK